MNFNKTHSDFVDVKGRTLTEVVDDLESKEVIVEDASTTKKGIVQLSNATDSTDETKAATPKAVNDVRNLIKGSPVQSVNGQTGAVTLTKNDLGLDEVDNVKQAPVSHVTDENVHGIGDKEVLKTNDKTSIVGAINELFQSASDGKTAIADAVTAKGVPASPADTFPTLATKIGQILTGKKFATGEDAAQPNGAIIVSGLEFKPTRVLVRTLSTSNLNFHNTIVSNFGVYADRVVFKWIWNADAQRIDAPSAVGYSEDILILNDDGFQVTQGLGTSGTVYWEAYA